MSQDESLLGTYLSVTGAIFVLGALAAVAFVWVFPPPHHHASLEYQGAASCRECHEEQVELWEQTHMAQSFAVLRPGERAESKVAAGLDPEADYSAEPRCLACHATGSGLVGGFVSLAETPEMAGVSCEACHGPGGRYAGSILSPVHEAMELIESIPAERRHSACRRCHNEESPFSPTGTVVG